MSDRAARIRNRALVTLEVNGNEYLVRRPGVLTLIKAGAQRLTHSHMVKVKDELAPLVEAQDVDGILERVGGELAVMQKLCLLCMVDPKLHDGPLEDCPDGAVTIEMIEDDYLQVGSRLLELAGQSEALAAAKAAEAFREDGRGEAA